MNDFYDKFHGKPHIQKKIITTDNFTYTHIVPLLEKALRYLGNNPRVLDLGCGVGTIDFYLSKKVNKITAIDISKNAINKAKKSSSKLGIDNIDFLQGNIENITSKIKYDLILVLDSLEHVRDDMQLMSKVANLLTDSGYVLISIPSEKSPLYKAGMLAKFDSRVGHLRRYRQETITNLLNYSGYKVVHLEKHESIVRNLLFVNDKIGIFIKLIKGPLVQVFDILDRIFLFLGESNLLILAQKK